EYWQPAAMLLKLAGESPPGGDHLMARIAVMYGLRKGVRADPPEFDPNRKRDHHWGKRNLKRDE
ncbi:hypothetical protein, partial [uncultured Bradyrhizobium sp.]|uniref:hypothetical protein n=1 Tax=uncultured Bradyrhizobium sp. TaxID=199684 RepID=UPI0035C96A71